MKLRVARLLSVIVLCAVMALVGCMPTTPPSLSRHENIIPPTRTLVNSDGQTVEHNWLELPDISGKSEAQKFVTHYTTIGGKRVRNYSMLFDTEHRVALWVAYPLHQCYLGTTARTNAWDWDPKFSESVQPQVAYGSFGNPYQRGHQIPSADRLVSYEANAQTFYVTNQTAQNGTLNGNMWADLEGWVRTKICKDTLYVVTGCVVPPTGGERRCGATVPQAYFKALLRTQNGSWGVYASDDNATCIAFWVENKSNTSQVSSKQAMSVADLEDRLGYELFPAISRRIKEQFTPSRWALK